MLLNELIYLSIYLSVYEDTGNGLEGVLMKLTFQNHKKVLKTCLQLFIINNANTIGSELSELVRTIEVYPMCEL